jgi:hypothetical protein
MQDALGGIRPASATRSLGPFNRDGKKEPSGGVPVCGGGWAGHDWYRDRDCRDVACHVSR